MYMIEIYSKCKCFFDSIITENYIIIHYVLQIEFQILKK